MFVSPMVRNINILRQGTFMNYTVNVQFLLCAYYLGHSGDSLGFIAACLDLLKAHNIRAHYYKNSDELSMSIIKTANEMMDESLEEEMIAQYSIGLGELQTRQTIFNSDG